jgi:hypothetical protein
MLQKKVRGGSPPRTSGGGRGAAALAALAGAAAMALIGAGCGGGSSTASAKPNAAPTISTAVFIKRGDKICEARYTRVEVGLNAFAKKEGLDSGKPFTKAKQEVAVRSIFLPALKAELVSFHHLGLPRSKEKQAEAMVDGLEGAIKKTEKAPLALLDPDGGPLVGSNHAAKALGFKVCGSR